MKRASFVLLVVAALGFAASASPTHVPAQPGAAAEQRGAAAEQRGDAAVAVPGDDAAETARREHVYARVGAVTITIGQIEDAIAVQSPYQRARFAADPAK